MGVFDEFFVRPVVEHTGYNTVNTAAYAVVLVAAIFLVYKILVRMKIKLDRRLWLDLLPFVFLGGALRALQDVNFFGFLGVYHSLFVTPMIYIIIFALAFTGLIVSRYVWKDFLRFFSLALAAASAILVAINAGNLMSLAMIASLTTVGYAVSYGILRCLKTSLVGKWNSFNSQILTAHLLDASAAFVAVSVVGGYKESGVFTSFLFSWMPGWLFIPIKAVIALLVIYFIDKEVHGEMNWLMKFAVLVLGLGPGLHDTFTVLMGSSMA